MNELNRAAIVVNGEVKDYKKFKGSLESYDYLVAADGGANHLYKINITPNSIVGDMDSINQDAKEFFMKRNTEFIKFQTEKDMTDSQLSILKILENGYKHIDMFAAYGDRVDHFLANLDLLFFTKKIGLNMTIMNENNRIFLVSEGKTFIDAKVGQTVSFNNISGDIYGITLDGFKYLLDDADIKQGSSLLTSNIAIKNNPSIEIKKGNLLCVIVEEEIE